MLIATGGTVTFMFHSFLRGFFFFFFLFSGKVQPHFSLFVFFDFHSVVHRDGKVHYTVGSHAFFFFISRSSLLAWD